MRDLKLTYLEKVQQETTNFLNQRIKHDFLRPDRELTLDMTVREAELLMTANEEVRNLADSGELRKVHSRYQEAREKAELSTLNVRESLAKTLQIVESKENEIYQRLINDFGFTNIKLHNEEAPILDVFGFSSGDHAFSNLSTVEGAIENGHAQSAQLEQIAAQLHSYLGVKARIFTTEAEIKESWIDYAERCTDESAISREEY